jgi:heme ABC exporter ATP-binding subunit CcmA
VTGSLESIQAAPAAVSADVGGNGTWDVEVRGVWKSFGSVPVLRGLSLRIAAGQRAVIVGPNGSGKTTLLKILATLLRPSAGAARVAGFDVHSQASEVRRNMGILCHQTYLYSELTCQENLLFYARMYGVVDPLLRSREMLRLVGLDRQSDTLVRSLSRGMQQRLALARAIVHEPLVLLLDEPDTGLDQHWAGVLRDLVAERTAQGGTTLLTTHNLERSLDLADRVAVLNGGRIVFSARRDDLDVGSFKEAYSRYTSAAV